MYELNEGFKNHLKKNWKKYAVGAAVAGTAASIAGYSRERIEHNRKRDIEREAEIKKDTIENAEKKKKIDAQVYDSINKITDLKQKIKALEKRNADKKSGFPLLGFGVAR